MATNKNRKSLRSLKVVLSLFACYHLFGVILAPNSQTYLGLKSAPFYESYLHFFEFMSNWGFFAPEPGPPPVFVEWELQDQKGNTLEIDRIPSYPDPYWIRERQNRRMALVRFMIGQDQRIEKMMVPFLCRSHPNAAAVKLWKVGYGIPSLLDVVNGKRKVGDDENKERHWVVHSFCKEVKA